MTENRSSLIGVLSPRIHDAVQTPSLRRSTLWTGAGDAVYAVCQWGLLVVAITAPVVLFSNLGLRPLQSTDAQHQFSFRDYLTLRLIMNTVALGVIVLIAAQYRIDMAATIFVVGVAKCVEAVSDVYFGLLQKHERMDLIAISLGLKGIFSLSAFASGFLLFGTVLGASGGLLLAWSIVLIIFDIRKGRTILALTPHSFPVTPVPRFFQIRTLMTLAVPVGIGSMLLSLNSSLPRYFIERFWGEGSLGIYAGMAYVTVAMGMLVNSVGQSLSPRLSQYWAAGSFRAFRGLLGTFALSATVWGLLGIGAALAGAEKILTLLYGDTFADHSQTFVWLMAVAAIAHLSSVCGYGMTAARIIRSQSVQFACVAVVGLIGSLILIPRYGLNGAAWSFGASVLTQLVLSCLCLSVEMSRRVRQLGHSTGDISVVKKAPLPALSSQK
jgi:O-antigen/teichoic acid export membrane protein